MALFTTSTDLVSRTRRPRCSRRDDMCHASQASGSAPGSASAHLFGAPRSASELLPVDAASVAEGGSGLAPSSSSRAYSARPACGSATATAKGTAASVASAKAEDAAANVVVRSLLDQRPLQPSFLDISGCDWLQAATYEKFLGDIRVLVSFSEDARIRWMRSQWRDFCSSIAISIDGVDAACSSLTASAAVPL
jgi:hypothetical protein